MKNTGHFFTTRVTREALRFYAQGLSCRKVAAILSITFDPAPSQETIYQWARVAGIIRTKTRANELREARRQGKNFDAIREEARHLAVDRLWSVRRISEQLHVSRGVVTRALAGSYESREHLLTPREATIRRKWQAYLPDVEQRRARRDEVIDRRERGETYTSIAAALGVSRSTVYSDVRGLKEVL
jgi:transposase